MIVCHCRAVNHREIHDAVDAGARTVAEVGASCSAGTRCGGCWPEIADIVERRTGVAAEPTYRIRSARRRTVATVTAA